MIGAEQMYFFEIVNPLLNPRGAVCLFPYGHDVIHGDVCIYPVILQIFHKLFFIRTVFMENGIFTAIDVKGGHTMFFARFDV